MEDIPQIHRRDIFQSFLSHIARVNSKQLPSMKYWAENGYISLARLKSKKIRHTHNINKKEVP